MRHNLLRTAIFFVIPFGLLLTALSCDQTAQNISMRLPGSHTVEYKKVGEIPLPSGYDRQETKNNSFAEWLRNVALKSDKTVYLYDGNKKLNQGAQYAVLDISVGKKDLQQCADAVMRLRAEYLYSQRRFNEIVFYDNAKKAYRFSGAQNRAAFDKYLEQVFSWCGTLSLENQLTPVKLFKNIQAGDVLIKGGSPGHAVIVMDVAQNAQGEKIFLLAQSYMPAQDIHILRNTGNSNLSPWYAVDEEKMIETPEWTFTQSQLRTW